jgi:hypothetical protein
MTELLAAVDQAPTDLLSCVLTILCGLLVAAVCWIAKAVIGHGQDIARLNERSTESDKKFEGVAERLDRIEGKLDKVLEDRK